MEHLSEMTFFEQLLDDPRNELVIQAEEEGRIPIGYNCYLVPEPLLSMGKAFPVRLRAPGTDSTELANYYMSTFICSYARSILESALDGRYDFLGGYIYASCCTHINRCSQHFELLNINSDKPDFFTLHMDPPRKVYDGGIGIFIKGMKQTAEKLSSRYGIDTRDEALTQAIKEYNEFNRLMREIADFRKEDNPKITGTEFHTIMVSSKIAPRDMLIEPLKNLKMALEKREGIKDYKARVMVLGSIFDNPEFTRLIEEQGAIVVADRYCFGSLPGLEHIEEDGDPYENIARHYLETCDCPRMMEKGKIRLENALSAAREYSADGIILQTMKFCDLWGYEALVTLKNFRNSDIPLVRIEREYPLTGEGQLRTRFQAFIELIENKRMMKSLKKQEAKSC